MNLVESVCYLPLYHAIENTANQNTGKPCIFDDIQPNLPIVRCHPIVFSTKFSPRIFYGMG